jgi:hypothetical protein
MNSAAIEGAIFTLSIMYFIMPCNHWMCDSSNARGIARPDLHKLEYFVEMMPISPQYRLTHYEVMQIDLKVHDLEQAIRNLPILYIQDLPDQFCGHVFAQGTQGPQTLQ